jgi:hypothetical protein
MEKLISLYFRKKIHAIHLNHANKENMVISSAYKIHDVLSGHTLYFPYSFFTDKGRIP